MFYVTPEQLAVFKHKANEVFTNEPELIDQKILRLVMLINNIPGIATVFSCSGHTLEELERQHTKAWNDFVDENRETEPTFNETFPEFEPEDTQVAHVIFVASEEGKEFLVSYGKWLAAMTRDEWILRRPELQAFQLMAKDSEAIGSSFYMAWKLQVDFHLSQEGPEDAVESLENFHYFYRDTLNRQSKEEMKLHSGVIDLTMQEEEKRISVIKFLATVYRLYNQKDRYAYWLGKNHLTSEFLNKLMAPLELMDYNEIDGRLVELRTKEDELAYSGVVDKDIIIKYNRLGKVIEYSIRPTSERAKELIAILEPSN